jgi:chromate transport protein ChrA
MNRPIAICGVFALLLALPLCAYLIDSSPQVVFFSGAAAFVVGVLALTWFKAGRSASRSPSPPAARRFHFTIRDLLCLTTVLFGMTVFIISGFRCEAAERSSRPEPLPAATFRQFVWELEAGLACMAVGGLVWIRSTKTAPPTTSPSVAQAPRA